MDGNNGNYCHTAVYVSGAWFKVTVSGDYVVNKVVIYPCYWNTQQDGLARSTLIYSNDPNGVSSVIYQKSFDNSVMVTPPTTVTVTW